MWSWAYFVKMSDLMLTASLFNDAVLTINYSLCVISGFRRLTNDTTSLRSLNKMNIKIAGKNSKRQQSILCQFKTNKIKTPKEKH
jgi:hypothetical protein